VKLAAKKLDIGVPLPYLWPRIATSQFI